MSMRVTNSMITLHSKSNINTTKGLTDKYNDQMTSQKKISKPSDDPVIAIRSLRLRDSLNEVTQYTDKNIPDAESWLSVTETALTNMSNILKDIYTQCVNGSTGTLTTDDRNTILKNLSAYVDQLYAEGNADYAGRTVFTGFKTNQNLIFEEDIDKNYTINQTFDIDALENNTYYSNVLTIPNDNADLFDPTNIANLDGEQMQAIGYDRIRLAYGDTSANVAPTINMHAGYDADGTDSIVNLDGYTFTDKDGNTVTTSVSIMPLATWQANDYAMANPGDCYYIPETGELVMSPALSEELKSVATANGNFALDVQYAKDSFSKGDVKPEMYFNCSSNGIDYVRENQDINYSVAANQTLNVNTQAGEGGILSTSIARDVEELMNAVTAAQNANDKYDKIKAMLESSQYEDADSQEALKAWLGNAEREKTLLEERLQSLFSDGITKFRNYKQDTDLAITDVGSRASRLSLTKTRMTAEKSTINTLISDNEDRELSDILIDYESAYTAYQSSLTAASKINKMTLLDYI